MKRYNSKLTSRKFIALFISTGTGLFSLGPGALAQEAAQPPRNPAIVLRPGSHQVNDCEIEMDKPEGSSGYRLLINIPDSVSTIEVAPSRTSQRRFRIRMDDPSSARSSAGDSTLADGLENSNGLGNSNGDGKLLLDLRRPIDAMADAKWLKSNSSDASVEPETSLAANASTDQLNTRSMAPRYVANPFFKAPEVAEIVPPERVAGSRGQRVGRSLKADPVTIEEVANIKTVSLNTNPESEVGSVATAFTARPESNVDSISVAPMPTEMLDRATDFKPLKLPAPNLADVEYLPEFDNYEAAVPNDLPHQELAINTMNNSPEPSNSPQSAVALPVNVAVAGPENLVVGNIYDYTITVSNDSMIGVEDLSLAITTPIGVDVKVIEKPGTFDEATKTLTWELPRIEAGSEMVFRYKISTTADGRFQQKTVLWQGNNVSATISSSILSEN